MAVRIGGRLPAALADVARRRLEFAVGRFHRRVRSLTLRLVDVNGPRGGVDKKCLVTIRLGRRAPLIVIEETDADARAAIDRAADRAARAVARAFDKLIDWRPRRLAY